MKKRCIAIILMAVMILTVFPPQHTYAAESWKLVEIDGYYYGIDQSSGQLDWSEGSIFWNGKYYTYATGWQKIDSKWYYFNPYGGWAYYGSIWEIDGKWYAFYENGVMRTGWIKEVFDDGYVQWYYASGNGVLATGWKQISGKWYYFDPDYPYMYHDEILRQGNKAYLLTSSGAMATGWCQCDALTWFNAWYYANSKGELQKGWQNLDNKWYYFDPVDYYMYANDSWYAGSKVYLFNPNGTLVSKAGWIKLSGSWYYANADGTPCTGWKKIDGNYYYFVPDWGIMETSSIVINGVLYKFNSNGVYTGTVSSAGWHKINGIWHYIKSDGVAAVGWQKINNKWYYFSDYGYMLTGAVYMSEGTVYFFDASGAMITKAGWQREDIGSDYPSWYYVDSNGKCRTGWQKINNKWYYFDPDSAYMYAYGEFWINDKPYTFDENGVWVG